MTSAHSRRNGGARQPQGLRVLDPIFLPHLQSILLLLGSWGFGKSGCGGQGEGIRTVWLGGGRTAVKQLTFTLAPAKPPAVFALGVLGDLLETSV